MKAEHRHELKTNELADWMAHFPQWAKKNRNMIIYMVVLAIVVVGLYVWKGYSEPKLKLENKFRLAALVDNLEQAKQLFLRDQIDSVDVSLRFAQLANDFKQFASMIDDKNMAALALIKRGQALRMDMHYRTSTPDAPILKSQMEDAIASYEQAITNASKNPNLAATATFSIGLCHEEMGDFAKAREIYSQVSTNAEFEGTIAVAQAKQRLGSMSDYEKKLVFKAPPAPQPIMIPTEGLPTEFVLPEITAPNQPGL